MKLANQLDQQKKTPKGASGGVGRVSTEAAAPPNVPNNPRTVNSVFDLICLLFWGLCVAKNCQHTRDSVANQQLAQKKPAPTWRIYSCF